MMTTPTPTPPTEHPVAQVETVVLDRMQVKVVEWRREQLMMAGWSGDGANHIANMTMNDLMDLGYSEEAAAHSYPDFWRLAVKAMACGDESLAAYILGITSER